MDTRCHLSPATCHLKQRTDYYYPEFDHWAASLSIAISQNLVAVTINAALIGLGLIWARRSDIFLVVSGNLELSEKISPRLLASSSFVVLRLRVSGL